MHEVVWPAWPGFLGCSAEAAAGSTLLAAATLTNAVTIGPRTLIDRNLTVGRHCAEPRHLGYFFHVAGNFDEAPLFRLRRLTVFGFVALAAAVTVAMSATARGDAGARRPTGAAAARLVRGAPLIRVTSVRVANSRLVVEIRIKASSTATRWKLRIDGKALSAVSLKTKSASSPFLAPGDHRVQALLLNRRGAPLAVSALVTTHVDAVVAAAGDVACDPTQAGYAGTATECHFRQTAALLGLRHYAAILTLGDEQYECGASAAFSVSYDPTWGRYKAITHPAVGDHEYGTTKIGCPKGTQASGYYEYFGAAAGDPTKGYYSFDLGGWHIVVLNGNCDDVGGCFVGSPQEQWLAADLAAHPTACTLAYWHQPRFTSGLAGDDPQVDPFWRDLYASHAELVLNGHAHVYERFAPQTPDATAAADGLAEFMVGVGGRSLSSFEPTPEPLSMARQADTFGILSLTLGKNNYSWQFIPEQGKSYSDSGSARCH